MKNSVEEWVNKWSIEENDETYRSINRQFIFFSKFLFHDYQPIQGSAQNFHLRLEKWLNNVDNEDDKKTLFKLLPYIFYIGGKEIINLYRVAYNETIAKWLIDIEGIQFDDLEIAKKLIEKSIRECWICPITDSLDINSFFHINNIPSNGWNEMRPQWYGITRDGGGKWLSNSNIIRKNDIKKLILLEDFVGSGSQIEPAIRFLMDKKMDLDVLLISLINCPKGIDKFKELETSFERLTCRSVIELSDNSFIRKTIQNEEPILFSKIRELIKRVYPLTSGGKPEGSLKPYSPFGYSETGGLVVKYTNTPDNTIPSIHWTSKTWEPIFPRHSRN